MPCSFLILILIGGIVQDAAFDVRLYIPTSALLSRGGIHPRTNFLDDHDHTSLLHLLTRILMKVFTRPWLT